MPSATINGKDYPLPDNFGEIPYDRQQAILGELEKRHLIAGPKSPDKYTGAVLPVRLTADDKIRPGWGLLGTVASSLYDAFKLPGDVATGVQPVFGATGQMDPDLVDRSGEAALTLAAPTPAALAGRASMLRTPTGRELMDTGTAGFETARGSGSQIRGGAARDMVNDLEAAYTQQGRVGPSAANTRATVANLAPAYGRNTDLDMLLAHRKTLMDTVVESLDKNERAAAVQAVQAIDKLLGDPKAQLAGAIDAPELAEILRTARSNQAAGHRSNELTGELRRGVGGVAGRAAAQAGATASGMNFDNLVRQGVVRFLAKESNLMGMSDAEVAMLKGVADGTAPQNAVRWAANFLGGGGGLGAGKVAGTFGGLAGGAALASGVDPAVSAGIAALAGGGATGTGSLLKALENMMSRRSVRQADEAFRQRTPLYEQRLARQDPASSATGVGGMNLSARDLAVLQVLLPGLLAPNAPAAAETPSLPLPRGYI